MEQNTGFKELFLRLVAIVGLIAVLVLGAWGIILLAFNLVGLFTGSVHLSNLFSNKPAVVQQQATTTAPVVITQNNNGKLATPAIRATLRRTHRRSRSQPRPAIQPRFTLRLRARLAFLASPTSR
jgi:hypothetical protein